METDQPVISHCVFDTAIGTCGVAWSARGLVAVQLPARDDLSGLDPFRRQLYETMRGLPWGRTTTYGALARTLGLTQWEGARDVGEAMGRNPVPIVIPCHRVLAAGQKLGGFSAPGGAATKSKLLALEGVRFDGGAPRLPGL